jgi:hypothetical protein
MGWLVGRVPVSKHSTGYLGTNQRITKSVSYLSINQSTTPPHPTPPTHSPAHQTARSRQANKEADERRRKRDEKAREEAEVGTHFHS